MSSIKKKHSKQVAELGGTVFDLQTSYLQWNTIIVQVFIIVHFSIVAGACLRYRIYIMNIVSHPLQLQAG